MIYWLFAITTVIVILNLLVFKLDYMHPSFLFSAAFWLSEMMCIANIQEFDIVIHYQTVLVVVGGLLVFFIVGVIVQYMAEKMPESEVAAKPKEIYINDIWVAGLIFVQLLSIVFFIKYLKNISLAYNGQVGSITELISLYDTMTKFWTELFNSLNVAVPIIYRIGNPISQAGAFLMIYVVVNNFVATKKIRILQLIPIFLQCVLILLNGSRSPLFRVITMIFCLFYVLKYKKRKKKNSDYKFFLTLILLAPVVVIGFVVLLNLMGRGNDISLSRYVFIYTGAPLVNLDNYITSHILSGYSYVPGGHVFGALFKYIWKLTGTAGKEISYIYPFVFSNNGIEIGNVYTTFYELIYDFGYYGVAPLIAVMAIYYVVVYTAVIRKRNTKRAIDFRLFIYTYLFNDLIMSIFSARFYQTVCDAPFIKLVVFALIFDYFIIEDKFRINRHRFKISFGKTKSQIALKYKQ